MGSVGVRSGRFCRRDAVGASPRSRPTGGRFWAHRKFPPQTRSHSPREVFLSQSALLELAAPLKICGDVHGQYHDLLRIFEYGGFPPESNYIFLGDPTFGESVGP